MFEGRWRAALLGALAAACATGESSESAPELICEGECEGAARCGTSVGGGCVPYCVEYSPGYTRLSTDGAALIGDCLARANCDDRALGIDFELCWEEASERVAPTGVTRRFCGSYTAALFDCGYFYSTRDCEGNFALWSDVVVERASSCTPASSCGALQYCIDSAFQ